MGRNRIENKVEWESVRVEKEAVSRVRPYVAMKRQTIGGFISVLINKEMERIEQGLFKKGKVVFEKSDGKIVARFLSDKK